MSGFAVYEINHLVEPMLNEEITSETRSYFQQDCHTFGSVPIFRRLHSAVFWLQTALAYDRRSNSLQPAAQITPKSFKLVRTPRLRWCIAKGILVVDDATSHRKLLVRFSTNELKTDSRTAMCTERRWRRADLSTRSRWTSRCS